MVEKDGKDATNHTRRVPPPSEWVSKTDELMIAQQHFSGVGCWLQRPAEFMLLFWHRTNRVLLLDPVMLGR